MEDKINNRNSENITSNPILDLKSNVVSGKNNDSSILMTNPKIIQP